MMRAAPRRSLLVLTGAAAASAMLAHVLAGHAAANPGPWQPANIAIQWLHFAAVGAWIGGLAALLVALRTVPCDDGARAVRRFSAAAVVLLGVVAATGILRAIDEVGSVGALVSTGFGRLVDLKAFLLVVLASLGAVNRYRNVPRGPEGRPGLLRVGDDRGRAWGDRVWHRGVSDGLRAPEVQSGAWRGTVRAHRNRP